MTPCRTFKYRDRINNVAHIFEEIADNLAHGNEPEYSTIFEVQYQLKILSDMIEADCAEIEWEEEKKEMEAKGEDIFTHWLNLGKNH